MKGEKWEVVGGKFDGRGRPSYGGQSGEQCFFDFQ